MYPFVRLLSSGTTIIPRAAAPVTDVQVLSVIDLCDCRYLRVKQPRPIVHLYNACRPCLLIGKKLIFVSFMWISGWKSR
jgi:hypothetical protein